MTAPLVFLDTESRTRACEFCGGEFAVKYPSDRRRFCSYSCSVKSRGPRPGAANPNWRGGKASHPLYDSYTQMIARCHNPKHRRYADYGGRGIYVCDRWQTDFWAFVTDMGERPDGMWLDRINNDGPYAPENCRWADPTLSNINRRTSGWQRRQRRRNGQFE